MIFIDKTSKNGHAIFNQLANLDLALITNIKKIANDESNTKIISFNYGEGFDDKLFNLPFVAKDVIFMVRITDTDIYTNAVITFMNDKDYQKFEECCTFGSLDLPVRMTQEEKIKLLIYLLKNT